MKRAVSIVCSLALLAGVSLGQAAGQETDSELSSARQTFESASPEVKLRQLNDVLERDNADQFGPLYGQALQFLVSQIDRIDSSLTHQRMLETALRGVETSEYGGALDSMWSLFRNIDSTNLRIQIVEVSAIVGAEDEEAKAVLNRWVRDRLVASRDGATPDARVVAAAVSSMGRIGDPLFFDSLLRAALSDYDSRVTEAAEEAIASLDGSLAELAGGSFSTLGPAELDEALSFFLASDALSDQEKSELARVALSESLNTSMGSNEGTRTLRNVRSRALEQLISTRHSEATDVVIEHFNRTVQDYYDRRITKGRLLDAISGLGAMGNEAAARRLSRYLELLNTLTESDRPVDTQIVLHVAQNLEALGMEVAYNSLFYASLLDYPQRVRDGIESALSAIAQ